MNRSLHQIAAGDVGGYFEHPGALPTNGAAHSALRRFFNLLVEQHLALVNPATLPRPSGTRS